MASSGLPPAATGRPATPGTLAWHLWHRPYVLLLLPPLFWAGNLLIGRAFADRLPPLGLTFWRWVVASLCVLPFTWRELVAQRRVLLKSWPVLLGCSAFGFAGYPVLNYVALHSTPAATAAMLNSTLPLMVPVMAWLVAREVPGRRALLGIAVSTGGVLWLLSHGNLTRLLALSFGRGELLMLLAVAGFALYSTLLRYRPPELSGLGFMAALSVVTTALLLPAALWDVARGRHFPIDGGSIASLLFIGVFSSLIANVIWNRCVATLGPTLTGASFHLMAVYASLLAFLLLHEPLHGYHGIGIALILAGFAVALPAGRREP
jgi:drug/metabolite transporter (DMT)-like permease